ncbi:hypothetical protein ACU6TU_12000 [Halomonas sp. LS-001]
MPLFFIHIPKTAGTSFRLGAEAYFSRERIVYDYGPDSDETSSLVQASLYVDQPDFWQFRQALFAENPAMVAGHVSAGRFVSLLGVENTVAFVREPLQRIASEYGHFVRNMNYQGSFREFYSRPAMHNRQRKALQGVNIEALGLLGVTERYSESLEMLNARFVTCISRREDNQGKEGLKAEHRLNQEDITELQRLNQQDMTLYQNALALFDARYQMFKANLPWAHARLAEANTHRVSGWAWWAGSHESDKRDEPLDIEIWVNDELVSTVRALEFRKDLCRVLPPRGGYVGFHLPMKLSPRDQVQCRVASTGQWFPLSPRRVLAQA